MGICLKSQLSLSEISASAQASARTSFRIRVTPAQSLPSLMTDESSEFSDGFQESLQRLRGRHRGGDRTAEPVSDPSFARRLRFRAAASRRAVLSRTPHSGARFTFSQRQTRSIAIVRPKHYNL